MKLAIITARGGSKRIPRKNIRDFCGKPIIAYPIRAALDAKCFDEVIVSTDDREIADVARTWGASVPFMRSARTATDHATTAEVLMEVLEEYHRRGVDPDLACAIYPTAPFVTPTRLSAALDLLLRNEDIDGVIPVVRFSYPIQRALRMKDGLVSMIQPNHLLTRSQDLEPAYHDVGQFYWFRVAAFKKGPTLMGPRTAGMVLPERVVQDIDDEEDWLLAEMKYRLLQEGVERSAASERPPK
jgi:N-acylneuraminate cytidylyltransferase